MYSNALLILTCIFVFSGQVGAQSLSDRATTFLNLLSADLKAQTLFPLDGEERFNLNFVPMPRKGPTFHDFNEKQRKAALDLLKASVSEAGYSKSTEIMDLEKVLAKLENNTVRRDPLNYHFCIFGEPSREGAWGWRLEGHHLSLNFASKGNTLVSSTPSFMGSNPAIVSVEGFERKQVLRRETELGLALINSLDKQQLTLARFAESAPAEIITGNDRKAHPVEPRGIQYKQLTQAQQAIFMDLLNEYINSYEFGFAQKFRKKIEDAGIENLSFAWAGGLKQGEAHYYRVQGPMLLIEYDNIQNNANHVHTIVRDLTNDFAEDILREHYRQHQH